MMKYFNPASVEKADPRRKAALMYMHNDCHSNARYLEIKSFELTTLLNPRVAKAILHEYSKA